MSISATPHRSLERRTAGNHRATHQSPEFRCFHGRRHLPPALADRSLFQDPQTEPESQNVRRYFRKCLADPDLDSTHRDVAAALASLSVQKELVVLQSRIPVAHEP